MSVMGPRDGVGDAGRADASMAGRSAPEAVTPDRNLRRFIPVLIMRRQELSRSHPFPTQDGLEQPAQVTPEYLRLIPLA